MYDKLLEHRQSFWITLYYIAWKSGAWCEWIATLWPRLLFVCVPFEVRSDADETVEYGVGLLWLLGVLCEVCTEATETAGQRRYDKLNRIKWDSRLACSENKENSVKVAVEQRVNIMAAHHMTGYWVRGRTLVCNVWQYRKSTCNATLRRVRATTVIVET